MLAAPEHQEMNRKVEVIWRTLRAIAHYLMVHARVLEACIHFVLLYTTDHISTVLQIKYMINKDGKLTTPFKHATGTNLQYHIYACYFFHVLYVNLLHTLTKVVKYTSPSAKGFFSIFVWIPQNQKEYLEYVLSTRKIISSYDFFIIMKVFLVRNIYVTSIFRSNGYASVCDI